MPGLIGSLSDLFTSPQLNPGVRMVNGVPVDANGNPTTLYQQPNWFQRLGPEGKNIAAMNAQISGAPLLGQQASQEALARANLYGQQGRQTEGMLAGTGALDPNAMSSMSQLFAKSDAGTFPAEATAAARAANQASAQAPPEANPFISKAADYSAQYGLPAENVNKIFSLEHPGFEQGLPNMFSLNPDSGVTGVVRNPVSLYGSLMGNGGMTAPSGNIYPSYPPGSLNTPPTDVNPFAGQSSNSGASMGNYSRPLSGKLTQIPGMSGYETDDDGKVYQNGKYIPSEQIKGTPLDKMVNSIKSYKKELQNFHNTKALPHGLGYELGNFVRRGFEDWARTPSGQPIIPAIRNAANSVYEGSVGAYDGLIGE